MAFGNYRSYLARQGLPLAAPAPEPAPYAPVAQPNQDQVNLLRALTAAGMRPAVGGFGMNQLAAAQAQPQPAQGPVYTVAQPAMATAGQPNAVMMARILAGMAEEEKARAGDAVPQVTVGGVTYQNPGTFAESGMDPAQYAEAVTQVTRNFLRDYYLKKSQEAAAANAPGTQTPSIPYVDPAINAVAGAVAPAVNAATDFGGNVVRGVGIAGQQGAATLGGTAKSAGQAVVDEATGLGQEIGQKYVARTTPRIVGVDPYSGEPIYSKAGSPIGAAYTSVADTLIPAAAGGVMDVGGAAYDNVVKPVAGVLGRAGADVASGLSGDYWDQLSPDTKTQIARSMGVDHVPTSAELKHYAGEAIRLSDYPRANIGAPLLGELLYHAALGDAPFGLGVAGDQLPDSVKQQIILAYQQGGGKGVWENYIAKGGDWALDPNNPLGTTMGLIVYGLYHAGIDIAADPTFWAPMIGEGLRGVAEARAFAELARGGEIGRGTKAINVAADVLRLPNTVPDKALEIAGAVPGRVLGALPEGMQDAAARLKQIAGLAPNDQMRYAQKLEEGATAAQGYAMAEKGAATEAATAALPGAERFPIKPGEEPIYVSSDGGYVVTKGPAKMKGQPEEYFVYDQQGHLVGMDVTPEKAIDKAEQVAFRRGAGRDAGARFAEQVTPPTAPAAGGGSSVMLDGATGKWTVYLEDGSKWPFETRAEANAFKAELDAAPAAPVVQEPNVIREATAGGPPVVEPTPKPVPIEQPAAVATPAAPVKEIPILRPTAENPLPGWSVEPKPGGTRAIDVLAARDPALYNQIKADVLDRAANYYEPLLNASRETDPVANRVLNAELHLEIAQAAKARGVDLPVSEWELGRKARTAATAETVPARVDRILFNPNAAETAVDRNALYARGVLRKEPPRDFADVLDAKPRKGPPGYVNDLVVPDSAFGDLPPEIQAYSAGKIATDKAGKPVGHVFTPSDLEAMPMEQRKTLVRTLQARQQHAFEANQLVQDARAKLHGTAAPETPAPAIETRIAANGHAPAPLFETPPVDRASTPAPNGAAEGASTPTVETVASNGHAPEPQQASLLSPEPTTAEAAPNVPDSPDSVGPDALVTVAPEATQEAMIRNLPQSDIDWLDKQVQSKRIWEHERDRYRETGVQKVPAGIDRDGETIYRYPYTPEVFIKSDASGMPMRHYIQLPSGKVIHPDEIGRVKAVRAAARQAELSTPENVARVEANRAREQAIERILRQNPRYQAIFESASRRAFGQPNSMAAFERILAQNPEYQAMRADAIRQLDEAAAPAAPEVVSSNGHAAPNGRAPQNFGETTIDNLKLDPAQYQMRNQSFVEEHVQDIMRTFDENNLDPLKVRDNGDGTYTVLAGHNRYEAIRRMVADGKLPADFQVPFRIAKGDQAKLLDVALTSNNLTRELLPSELGANLQRQLDAGKSWSDLLDANHIKAGKARQALDINLLPARVKEMVDQGLIKENVGATLGEAIRKGKMSPEEVDDFWHKHGVNRVTKDGRANPYTPETLKFDLESLASAKAEAERQAQLKAAGAESNGMMGLFGDMQIDFGTKTVDDLLTRSQQLFEDLKAAKADEAAFKRVANNPNLSDAEKAPVIRERRALQARINQNEYELGRPLTKFDLPTPKPGKDTLGIVSASTRKQMEGLDWLKRKVNEIATPKGIRPLSETTEADPIGLITSDPIKAHLESGRMSMDHAAIMDRTIQVGTGRNAETMRLFERYDQLVLEGMTEKQAALQVGKEYAGSQVPRLAENKAAIRRGVEKAAAAYDAANQAIREAVMYNIVTGGRGSLADMIGDGYTMLVTGHGGALPDQFRGVRAIFRMVRHGDPIELRDISYLRELRDAGAVIPERYVDHAWTRSAEGTGDMTIVRAARTVGGDQAATLSRPVQAVLQNKLYRDVRNALDMGRRLGVLADQFGKEIRFGAKRFDLNLGAFARKTGQDLDELKTAIADAARERSTGQGGAWSGIFAPEDVKAATGNEQLARAWRSEVNRAMNVADKESQRVLFSYNRYPIDRQLGRVMYFHYWSTRALALHTGIALRNPWLLAAYMRTWDGLGKIAEAHGYPASLTGMVAFMGDMGGWTSFVNPLGLLVPYLMFSDLGNDKAPAWQRAGIYLSPFVEGGLAAMGMADTTPDITGTLSVRNMARAVMNWADANGHAIPGLSPDGRLTNDYVQGLEQHLYGLANDAAQKVGITSKDYGPYDPNTSMTAQIRAVIMQRAIDDYGPRDQWPGSLEAMVNDAIVKTMNGNMLDNPLSKAAYQEVAGHQLETRAMGMIAPGGVVTKYGPLETNRALNNAASAAYAAGTPPTPDQQAGSDFMDMVNAGSPEAMTLTQDQHAYAAIGDARAKGLSDGWASIAYGTGIDPKDDKVGVVIGGKFIRYADLANVSPDQRKALADQWVADWHGTADLKAYRDARTAFVNAHPEFGDFKDYQTNAYNYNGGLTKFRTDTAKANPNFAREMAAREKLIRDGGTTDPTVVSAELDQWAAGAGGYEAATGIKSNLYSDEPIATRDQSQVPYIAGQEGGSSSDSSQNSPKKSTADLLTADIAGYQQQEQLLNAMLAQHGMGNLDQYNSPYLQPWIQATFGDAMPKTTPLMDAYVKWANQQPSGADTSISAFAAQYDAVNTAVGSGSTISTNRLMTLYLAWKAQQPTGADTSPDAFARYLRTLKPAA